MLPMIPAYVRSIAFATLAVAFAGLHDEQAHSNFRAHSRIVCLLVLALIVITGAERIAAQPTDAFDDGDFVNAPEWSGDADRWQIGILHGPALRSMGAASADTIHLATRSERAFGTWRFTVAHQGVNLSSFNGVRIFFVSDRADTRTSGLGYYLQLGTNNADQISLWRADGDLRTGRSELARSRDALVAGDSSLSNLRVERDVHGQFEVYVNDSLLFAVSDNRYVETAYFVLWVKHTSQGAESFIFDNFSFEPAAGGNSPTPPPEFHDLVLNEIHFDPPPGASEFIELYNRSTSAFDASHLRIRDARSSDVPITRSSIPMAPGSFLVLVQDSAAFASEFRAVPFVPVRGWPTLNNTGDTIVLSTPLSTVDSLEYDEKVGIRGRSLERIDPDAPSDVYNFAPSLDGFGSTPGERNSVFAVDDTPPTVRFVDQIDSLTLEVHLSESIRTEAIGTESVDYDVSIDHVQPLTSFTLRVRLTAPPTSPALRLRGISDYKGNTSSTMHAPIAFLARPRDLVINEIMYEPRSGAYDGRPDQVEFVELVNVSDRSISLTELVRTREVDEKGDADTLRFGRELTALQPGGILVVSAHDSAAIRAAYPDTFPVEAAAYIESPGLTLLNGGDRIRIHNRLGSVLDDLHYLPTWHYPDLSDRRGVSLERIDLESTTSHTANWSSSVSSDGASPGAVNTVAHVQVDDESHLGLSIQPLPFSPDGDGIEDVAVITYRLSRPTSNIRVRIFDVNGFEVRRLVPAELAPSDGRVLWDGRDDAGHLLRIGIYVVVFEAAGTDGRPNEVYKSALVLARKL